MIEIPIDEAAAETHLPPGKLDGSGIGINYADAYLKPLKVTLPDGRKVACKRRGLKLTFTVGERTGASGLQPTAGQWQPRSARHSHGIAHSGQAGAGHPDGARRHRASEHLEPGQLH